MSAPIDSTEPLYQLPSMTGRYCTGYSRATADSAHENESPPSALLPSYIRLPRSGTRDPLSGLSRSALNALILPTRDNSFRPRVKSVVHKAHKHATRGTRLIVVASLLDYLRSLETQEEVKATVAQSAPSTSADDVPTGRDSAQD